MKYRILLIIVGLGMIVALSGCSALTTTSNNGMSQQNTPSETSISPAGSSTPAATSNQSSPSGTGTTTAEEPAASSTPKTSQATPGSGTISPGASVPSDWKSFTSSQFQISLSYPPNWTVQESQAGVDLSSPKGEMILLAQVATGGLSPQEYLNQNQLPNTRCTPSTNPQGLNVRTCFDTIARSYSAYVVVKMPQAGTELISLSLNQQSEIQTFETIIASLRTVGE